MRTGDGTRCPGTSGSKLAHANGRRHPMPEHFELGARARIDMTPGVSTPNGFV
jgi:hypothetical protein